MSFPRYATYKESNNDFIGYVPSHWSIRRLKYASSIIMGQSPSSDHYNVAGDGPGFLQGNGDFGEKHPRAGSYCAVATKFASPDDVLLSVRAPVGAINIADQIYGIGRGLCAIACHKTESGRFVYYSLHVVRESLRSIATGSTYEAVSVDQVANATYVAPPLAEQHAIASFLDRETAKIDALVAEQRLLIELLKEKRQAVISHAVTKGLDPNVPMKPSGVDWLGEVPEHWKLLRLKSVTDFITSGPRGWSERIGETGSLFIQSGDLNDSLGVGFSEAKRVLVHDDAEAVRTRLIDGDVVVCVTGAKTGKVAVCAVVPETAYVNQHLCLIRPNTMIVPMFLGLLLKSNLGKMHFATAQYGLKQGLSLQNVRDVPVLLPPHGEQCEIIRFIATENQRFVQLMADSELTIELLQERRTALISAAVTGKIDVRALASQEAA